MFKPITFITESRARNIQGCRFVEHMYVAHTQKKVDKLRNSRYYGTVIKELNREQVELDIEKEAFTNLSTEDMMKVLQAKLDALKEDKSKVESKVIKTDKMDEKKADGASEGKKGKDSDVEMKDDEKTDETVKTEIVIPEDYQELKELAFEKGFKGKKTEKRETYEYFLKNL